MTKATSENTPAPMADVRGFLSEAGFASSGGAVLLEPERSETREVHLAERSVVVTISTRARDRHGDIVDPSGVRLERYRRNPVVLYAHDHDGLPVARSMWERVRGGELIAKPQFHLQTELSREVWALVEKGVLSAWSVGFLPEVWEPAPGGEGFVIRKWDLLEYSCVPVPANFEALTRELEARRITAPALVRTLAPAGLRAPDLVPHDVREVRTESAGEESNGEPGRAEAGKPAQSVQPAPAKTAPIPRFPASEATRLVDRAFQRAMRRARGE